MLLTEFSVENFGVFRGKHVFDLRTVESGRKPVILFGGKNGTGKTTLFEGIRLCLYGANFRGQRLNRPQYDYYLKSRIHRRFGLAESEGSSVALEFEHVHQGKVSRYFVRRHWTYSHDTASEGLEVLRDGRPLDDVSSQQLQDFLIELIPLGLSRLFFFDGEQIQKLAEDQPDNKNLVDAFDVLLGIDLIEHLQTDLRIHLSRQLKEMTDKPIQSYETLLEEIRSVEIEVVSLRQSRAQKQTEIDHIMSEIERKEHELASEGGGFADRRQQLKSRKNEIEAEISVLESDIRDLASSLLPFAISPALCRSLRDRLLQEEQYQQALAASELLQKEIGTLRERLQSNEFWTGIPVDKDFRSLIGARLLEAVGEVAVSLEGEQTLVHQLSPNDQRKILHWIDQSLNWVPVELRAYTSRLESKTRELQSIEETLSRVPPNEAVSPIIRRLNELHQGFGELNHELKFIDNKIRQAEFRLEENERKVRRSQEEQQGIKAAQERTELGKRVQQTLKEFTDGLRRGKTKEVSERFVEAFNQLSTKKDLISRVQIDPETFSITLFRRNRTPVPKETLSAGEKQVYAIAMLTALARVSGKPLPFVIDTPLARLDSEHRTNLVVSFFPSAGHQVIVFSTNSEIDQEYYTELQPNISKVYLLRYDDSLECSMVSPGYFWEHPMELAT